MTAADCSIEGCSRPARSKGLCHSHYERARRTGSAGGALRSYGTVDCSVPGCPKPHKAFGLCALHYTRLTQFGDVNRTKQMPSGPSHWNWAGDAADYTTVHQRLTKYRGAVTSYTCAHCGHPAEEWAYDNADPAEQIAQSGAAKNCRYSTNLAHYLPLCVPCHKRFDRQAKAARVADHEDEEAS